MTTKKKQVGAQVVHEKKEVDIGKAVIKHLTKARQDQKPKHKKRVVKFEDMNCYERALIYLADLVENDISHQMQAYKPILDILGYEKVTPPNRPR